MHPFTYRLAVLATAAAMAIGQAQASPADDVTQLQQSWAQIKYQSPAVAQEQAFERLRAQAESYAAREPGSAEVLIWYAIVESTYAGAKGGIGALAYAKNAKKTLEQALALKPDALDGSAYTSLGSLYYQVPGWPIGFGDDAKARDMLKKGLAINPDGIDANYFYGDFLYRKGEREQAERFLRKALQAPARPGRKLADDGRRGEITALLDKMARERK